MSSTIQVAALSDLSSGSKKKYDVNGKAVLLINLNDQIYAIDNKCTHAGCGLANGLLNGNIIECPCHRAKFNIMTGKVVSGPATKALSVYRVVVENGTIALQL